VARPQLSGNTRLDRAIAYLMPGWAERRQTSRLRFEVASQFHGSEHSRLLRNWITEYLAPVNPVRWELETLRERSQDLNRNDPVASSATDTLGLNVVGQGLQPQSLMRAEVLGISDKEAQKLRLQAEQIFDLWAPFADAANRLDFAEIQLLAFRKIVEDGEIITVPTMVRESWRPLQRALEMVEAERLGAPFGKIGVFQGIEVGPDRKEPLKYWIRKANITTNDYEIPRFEWVGIPARDSAGRPMVIHTFPSKRPGQLRGIPFFAPALTYFKHLADYLSAELVAAKVAACLAIFITQEDPTGAAIAAAVGRPGGGTSTGAKNLEQVEPGSITRLALGESINVVDPKRGGETFNSFMEGVLRLIGVSLGLPYEQLVKDFSKTNYSSARAALLEGRRVFSNWRDWFGRKFCQPILELVLEEAYLSGMFEVRDFYAHRAEYCRVQWVGAGWGWVDPVKEVESSKLAIDWGLSTYARECAAQGLDWEENLEQMAREQAKIKELNLIIPEARAKQVSQTETAPLPGEPGGGGQ
jgi:lambda family phage portal protein